MDFLLGDLGPAAGNSVVQGSLHSRDRLVQQVHQTNRGAGSGLESLAVFSLDRTETNVLELLSVIEPTNVTGRSETHGKVVPLCVIRDVNASGGLDRVQTVLEGRHVGAVVSESAVRLLQHQGDLVVLYKDALCPALLHTQDTGLVEFVDDRGDLVVVEGFSAFLDRHVQPIIDLLEFLARNVTKKLPNFHAFFVSGLQFHYVQLCRLFKVGVVVESFLGGLVKSR
mmetsp:Transcript_26315/g.57646  ORF Transcript_26315/g.57646 Transcript_26315/m.57646 type:complete len:226 (+) Transcript_26315:704-1381(+)